MVFFVMLLGMESSLHWTTGSWEMQMRPSGRQTNLMVFFVMLLGMESSLHWTTGSWEMESWVLLVSYLAHSCSSLLISSTVCSDRGEHWLVLAVVGGDLLLGAEGDLLVLLERHLLPVDREL